MTMDIVTALDLPKLHERIGGILKDACPDVSVVAAAWQGDLWQELSRCRADLFVISGSLIQNGSAESIGMLCKLDRNPLVVVVSHREDPVKRERLIAAGCRAVLYSGLSNEEMSDAMAEIIAARRSFLKQLPQEEKPEQPPRELHKKPPPKADAALLLDFASDNAEMRAFMETVERLVNVDTTLLIQGETGTGKERLARAIHAAGARAKGPFIAINCGGLPESLLESELFGHEKGAFTGAAHVRRGCFELAHKGTIFLDEIGEMTLHFQVKLLRVLEEHKIRRVGGEQSIDVDVRVVAATNRDLHKEVEAKNFRSDLFYRLSVVTLSVPPLRARPNDLGALIDRYIEHFRAQLGHAVTGVSKDAQAALFRYSWPGNVRELINVLERAVLLCKGSEITLADLPSNIAAAQVVPEVVPAVSSDPLLKAIMQNSADLPREILDMPLLELRQNILEKLEREYISGLLRATAGRVGDTARMAGIEQRTLYAMMKKYNLRKEDFRPTSSAPV